MLPLPLTTRLLQFDQGITTLSYPGVGLTAKDRGSLATLCSLTMVSQEAQAKHSVCFVLSKLASKLPLFPCNREWSSIK